MPLMHAKKPMSMRPKMHKYASGGCIGAGCSGPHYDEGGDVKTKNQDEGKNNSSTNSAGVASASDIWNNVKNAFGSGDEAQAAPAPKPGYAHGGEVESAEDFRMRKHKENKAMHMKEKSMGMEDEDEDMHPSERPENYHFLGKEKLADGGEVEGHMDIAPEDDDEIHDMLGKELMESFHSKDHKKAYQSLEAMVLNCLNKDHKEDE